MRIKRIIVLSAINFITFLCMRIYEEGSLSNLYIGVFFQGDTILYLIYFFIFMCYCFYIAFDYEKYLSEFGSYVIIRLKNRNKLSLYFLLQTIKSILLIEFVKNIAYIIFHIITRRKFIWDINIMWKYILVSIITMMCMLLFQVILELYLTGQMGIILIGICYLASLVGGEIIYKSFIATNPKIAYLYNAFLLPNYIFSGRTILITKALNISEYTIIVSIIIILLMEICIILKRIKKIDII